MCFDEKNLDSKEGFVSRAIEKRVRNKRRRDPDMYVDVLLSSTVKRLKCELVNEQCRRKQQNEREFSHISKKRDTVFLTESAQKSFPEGSEVKTAVECLQSSLKTLEDDIRNESMSTIATNTKPRQTMTTSKQGTKKDSCSKSAIFSENTEIKLNTGSKSEYQAISKADEDDVDFDTLMQSLLEICEPLNDDVDELMKEYSVDPLSSGTFDFLNSNDPFLPGMFEVMCS